MAECLKFQNDEEFISYVKENVKALEHIQIDIPYTISIKTLKWYFDYCSQYETRKERIEWQNELLNKLSNYPETMKVSDALGVESIL